MPSPSPCAPNGASGMAWAEPAIAPSASAAAKMVRIMLCSWMSVGGGEGDAGAHFGDRLVDQSQRPFAMAALVGLGLGELGARRLQDRDGFVHVRLRAERIADAEAGRDGAAEHEAAG